MLRRFYLTKFRPTASSVEHPGRRHFAPRTALGSLCWPQHCQAQQHELNDHRAVARARARQARVQHALLEPLLERRHERRRGGGTRNTEAANVACLTSHPTSHIPVYTCRKVSYDALIGPTLHIATMLALAMMHPISFSVQLPVLLA